MHNSVVQVFEYPKSLSKTVLLHRLMERFFIFAKILSRCRNPCQDLNLSCIMLVAIYKNHFFLREASQFFSFLFCPHLAYLYSKGYHLPLRKTFKKFAFNDGFQQKGKIFSQFLTPLTSLLVSGRVLKTEPLVCVCLC